MATVSAQPTKRLHFSDPALAVLRNGEWALSGLTVKITQQLDRSLYTEVNKALEAMGGYWDKKSKAHVFEADPRESLGLILESGGVTLVKDGFFPTPAAVLDQMFSYVSSEAPHLVLEPSAGNGAILTRLNDLMGGRRHMIHFCELDPGRAEKLRMQGYHCSGGDFMLHSPGQVYDLIVMNPTFERAQDIDHVVHAYELLASGGRLISVMSEGAFFRNDKKANNFRVFLNDAKGASIKLPESSFASSGTGVRTRIVVINIPKART